MDYTERRKRATEALLNWDTKTRAELARLRAQRDALAAALRSIAEGCSFPSDDVQRAVRDRARAALATLDRKKAAE